MPITLHFVDSHRHKATRRRARDRWNTPIRCRGLNVVVLLLCVALPSFALAADSISYRSGAGQPITIEVTVEKIESGELYYTSARTSVRGHKPLENIVAMKVANEPALSSAEELFAAGKWDEAARAYAR